MCAGIAAAAGITLIAGQRLPGRSRCGRNKRTAGRCIRGIRVFISAVDGRTGFGCAFAAIFAGGNAALRPSAALLGAVSGFLTAGISVFIEEFVAVAGGGFFEAHAFAAAGVADG